MKRAPPIAKGVIGMIKARDKRIKEMETKQPFISPLKIKQTMKNTLTVAFSIFKFK